jgi:hypothetical protein
MDRLKITEEEQKEGADTNKHDEVSVIKSVIEMF